ncbi:MAG: hypothetical protein HOV97_26705 [Nonomuraea sp.]|nr:hypothetical protein [Nonomuraea sp.]
MNAVEAAAARVRDAVVPALRTIPAPAFVTSSAGRVAASNTARWIGGSVFRGEPGFDVRPCGDLSLVTGPPWDKS